ncbi:MAG TPA: hypothetical protein VI704_02620, partial [Bacteroidota bacterium]|nr:hypothetical protein [Bacteroidota bacterium]
IAHGIDMALGMRNQKVAVESGYWPLFRYNPMLELEGKNPFKLDSRPPKVPAREFMSLETRFKSLEKSHPDRAKELSKLAQEDVDFRWALYEQLAREGGNGKGATSSGSLAGESLASKN